MIKTALCTAALLCANLAGAAELTILIDDVKAANGNLMVAVYASPDTFLKQPANATAAPALVTGNKVVFKEIPEGEYAFVVYHDANSNGKLDKNPVGIPTEDYAFSNNALGKMGPPSYDSAKFVLPAAGATVHVSLK